MRRATALLLLAALVLAGCLKPDLAPRFTPAWEGIDTTGKGWHETGKALLVADCQVNNLYSLPLPERNLTAESMAATAIRPPQLDLFSPLVLQWILENDGPKADVVLHLGDAANLATTGEFARFLGVMKSAGRPWFMAPGNHDFFYMGVYDTTNENLREEASYESGAPLEKGQFIRTYVSTILGHDDPGCADLAAALGIDPEGDPAEAARKLPNTFEWRQPEDRPGLLRRICWKIDEEKPWRSFIIQSIGVDRPENAPWKSRVYLLDSCQYQLRPGMCPNAWRCFPIELNCGLTGEMLPDQLRKIREWLADREETEGATFMCHHPFDELAPRTKSSLGWLWREYRVGMMVTAHTHQGYFAHHSLGGKRDEIELNIGSTTDWPMEWRTLQGFWNPDEERYYLRSERNTLVDVLQKRGGFFLPGWEVPSGAPDDYREYKFGQPATGLLLSYYLGYHFTPYWLPPPDIEANKAARDTEIGIKNAVLWTYDRLIRTFPTDPGSAPAWPTGCSTDEQVQALIVETTAPEKDIKSKIAIAIELAAFEGSRHTRDPATGESTDDVRKRFKISQAAWASRYMKSKGRRLSVEDELIRVDWNRSVPEKPARE